MSAARGFAIFLIALVLGTGADPAVAAARAPADMPPTTPGYDLRADSTALSVERLRSWLAQSLTREGLSVRRRGELVEIDPAVTIRMLHGILAGLPRGYQVHVQVSGSGQPRAGVIGQITSRIVLQREDSRITERINAVRVFSFTVERSTDGWGTAPRVALGFDLPSDAAPFARVEVRPAVTRDVAPAVRPNPVSTPRGRRQPALAAPAVINPAAVKNAEIGNATDDDPGSLPVAGKWTAGGDGTSAVVANQFADPVGEAEPVSAASLRSSETVRSRGSAVLRSREVKAAAFAGSASASTQPAEGPAARSAPAAIGSVPAGTLNPNAWLPEFRVVKARASIKRRVNQATSRTEPLPDVSKTAPGPVVPAPTVTSAIEYENELPSTIPSAKRPTGRAQPGLPFAPVLLPILVGIAIGLGARSSRWVKPVRKTVCDRLNGSTKDFFASLTANINARLRSSISVVDDDAREPLTPSAAARQLLCEETRRTAIRIQERGESECVERLLELINREQQRITNRAA